MKKLLLLLIIPFLSFGQDSTLNGDVDCDEQITSEDASLILQFVTGVIEELPCEQNMTGLTPEQLQEMIDMMDEQAAINSEQSISMIGPMYLSDDFPEFKHFNTITTGSYIRDIALSWIDAKRFCGQLEYDGYNDWFLPSLNQIMNYYTANHFITISNINNFTSPWTSHYLFWTNSDTGAGAAGQSPYYKSTLSIYLPNTTITIENGDVLDTSNRLLYVSSASLSGDYRACFCVR